MSPRFLLAIDPGLDVLAAAVFDLSRHQLPDPMGESALRCLVDIRRVETSPGAWATNRADSIGCALWAWITEYGTCRVVCECPASFVVYGKNTSIAVSQLALAIGLVQGVCIGAGVPFEAIKPDAPQAARGYEGGIKQFRRDAVNRLCKRAGRPEYTKKNQQDTVDAVWLGIRAMGRLRSPMAVAS